MPGEIINITLHQLRFIVIGEATSTSIERRNVIDRGVEMLKILRHQFFSMCPHRKVPVSPSNFIFRYLSHNCTYDSGPERRESLTKFGGLAPTPDDQRPAYPPKNPQHREILRRLKESKIHSLLQPPPHSHVIHK